jgi:hypothetical protein
MLFVCVPGGFEHLVVAMSEPAGSRTLPPAAEGPPDMERVASRRRTAASCSGERRGVA